MQPKFVGANNEIVVQKNFENNQLELKYFRLIKKAQLTMVISFLEKKLWWHKL